MVNIPQDIIDIMGTPGTTKVLATVSKDGSPHVIMAGSIMPSALDTMMVGEMLMKKSPKNLSENNKASFLITAGKNSYCIDCTVKARLDNGPELDIMNEALTAMKLKTPAVWLFSVDGVTDQSPSPDAGKKLA